MPYNTPYSEWSEKQKEMARERTRKYRAEHPDMMKLDNEKTQARRRELYKTDAGYREKCKERSRATPPYKQREYREKLKAQIFDHYGRKCACCGETEGLFLTLGHVNGDGATHRKKLGGSTRAGVTARIYHDIVKRGFPDDIRIECYNCNCGAFRNGGVCPHVKLRQAPISTA